MPLDTPARIAILGAGPIGLEAALYARFLGYEVDVFERGSSIADSIRNWGHIRLFSPFGMNASPLGIAAIAAQEPTWQRPGDDELLTGQEFINRYLMFLGQTDLVVDGIHVNTAVAAVGREGFLKAGMTPGREESPFRVLTRSADDGERLWTADAVLDATGTYGNHNWLGPGGIPAVGEAGAEGDIEYGLPDILGRDRKRYAGRHVLVVGAGYSAATSVVALAELARQEPGTRVTWLTRRAAEDHDVDGPIPLIPDDRLEARRLLAETANGLAGDGRGVVSHIPGASVEQVLFDPQSATFRLELSGIEDSELVVDRIIANVGYRPDLDLYRELHVHTCYATEGPMKLAATLLDQPSGDCLDQTTCGPASLVNPEPNFFILGAKSYGRGSKFLLSVGLAQIREVFTILSGNPDLDLYKSIGHRRQHAAGDAT
jgi:thioredoxin reductase